MLYNTIETAKKYDTYAELPPYIASNLNPNFELRPYQKSAFQNFITYFENPKLRTMPSQVLFHMATGSGKTLIMAGLVIYLYKKGYRNFLFFVNLSNIVQKTKENFLNNSSSKYLFNQSIVIDGKQIRINEVSNFQSVDNDAINICFQTIQGLHDDMWTQKENSITLDDFQEKDIVMLSDEAHHLNAMTKLKGKKKIEEEENYHSWQETVERILGCSPKNILLEFTATCDIENAEIRRAYENKIIFDYPLKKFRIDKYSKEIITLRSDLPIMDKALQALMLSQYRLKVFQDHRLSIKPVILFKSAKVVDSRSFMKRFLEKIETLTGTDLERIRNTVVGNPTMEKVYTYFEQNRITFDNLAQELRDDFSSVHCVSVNDDKEATQKQILINSLEDQSNPYRAIFEVKKLDEGWDVLNLFDIVRLYETRQSSGKRMSDSTIAEAQLIGRGARYCPFRLNPDQPKYQRKYDDDVDNELRLCETLNYHCQNDSRYIGELHHALEEIGLKADPIAFNYSLKESFKEDDVYKKGVLFVNDRIEKPMDSVNGLPANIITRQYAVQISTGASGEDIIMEDSPDDNEKHRSVNKRFDLSGIDYVINDIVRDNNYNLIHKALRGYDVFKFQTLKSHFPNLSSHREFITDGRYLGNVKINISSRYKTKKELPNHVLYEAVTKIVGTIAGLIEQTDVQYQGTQDFIGLPVAKVIKDKKVIYNERIEGSKGFSQNDDTVDADYRIDLSHEDWFAFTENWGTSEEKAFVGYFKKYVPELRKHYDKIYLVRNERQFHIYSFENGLRFEPDYVIFLWKNKDDGTNGSTQLQIFVEPKGKMLLLNDKWKEDFLLQIKEMAMPTIKFVDDNDYRIWGVHFYCHNDSDKVLEFNQDFQSIIDAVKGK